MDSGNSYSWLERLLHQIAFKGIHAQRGLADIENGLFGEGFKHLAIGNDRYSRTVARSGPYGRPSPGPWHQRTPIWRQPRSMIGPPDARLVLIRVSLG